MIRDRSIRTKLALIMSFLIAVISLAIFIYFPSRLRAQEVRFMIEESCNITDMAAYSVAQGLLAGRREEVAEGLWPLRTNSRLAYVLVFDRSTSRGNTTPFAAFNEKLADRYRYRDVAMESRDIVQTKGKTIRTVGGFSHDKQIYQTFVPVLHRGRPVGEIYVGMSMSGLYAQVADSRRTIAWVSLIVFGFGVLAVIIMSGALTRSLRRIVETVEHIARGDLGRRAEVIGGDEVGQLASSFNTMVDRLQSAQLELAGLNTNLERRVAERSRELWDEMIERHRAEEAARISEQRHRHLFERNLAGIYMKTVDGRMVSCNDAFARMLGYGSASEFLALKANLDYEDPRTEVELLEQLMEKGSVTNREVRARTRSGQIIWLLENVNLSALEEAGSALLESIVLDITDRKRAELEIEHRAYHDALTGLANREAFKKRLGSAITQARQNENSLAVLFLDLDDLKVVNDTLGHPVGDQLLQQLGARLTACLRREDLVARVGGDEFTICLPEAWADAVGGVAQKIVAACADPFLIDENEVRVTTSVGVALYPDDGEDAETLLISADRTMYRVKEAGGNAYQFCSRLGARSGLGRLTLEQNLRRALERSEFEVYYQPQVNLTTSEIVGMEALVRWNHPDGMVVEPSEFIPLAENSGLIIPIGQWVLREACRQSREWSEAGFSRLRVSVNLSPRQFHQPDFLGMVRRAVDETGIDPRQLELEITESMAMQTTEWTISMLHKLKEMRLSIATDDFGTGVSSLSHLKRFPIDAVKIDRSFIRDLGKKGQDSAIVSGLLILCKGLSLRTVAEGVETAEQWKILREQGCEEMQGYYFSRPVPPERFLKLLQAGSTLPAFAPAP